MYFHNEVLLTISAIWWSVFYNVAGNGVECPRKMSKIVRNIINEDLLPFYSHHNVPVPAQCPLNPNRDIYGLQEANKYEENVAKWVCEFCGKAFYEERFLDMHFGHRHPNSLRQDPSSVCLAGWCDVFRCEVRSSRPDQSSRYWDQALCRETKLEETQHKCRELIQRCIPENLDIATQNLIQGHLNSTLCHYLTCDLYWEVKQSQLSILSLTFYIIATIILVFGACVYYVVLRSTLAENPPKLLRSDSEQSDDETPIIYPPHARDVRHRHSVS